MIDDIIDHLGKSKFFSAFDLSSSFHQIPMSEESKKYTAYSTLEYLRPELEYLGHVISKDGVKPNSAKLEAVKNFEQPRNVTEMQLFLGLAGYYRKFISNFSSIAKPLTELKKGYSIQTES